VEIKLKRDMTKRRISISKREPRWIRIMDQLFALAKGKIS
jgi:hypothetical protein